jgi:hypothetical protein
MNGLLVAGTHSDAGMSVLTAGNALRAHWHGTFEGDEFRR